MPTYDYFCRSCQKTFEIFHSMSEPARTICPECKKPTLQRKIGEGMGILFKGSGFYETDYKQHTSCGSCSHQGHSSCSGCTEKQTSNTCPKKTSAA